MKKSLQVSLFFLLSIQIFAQNPIVPPGTYIADPSTHIWNDGKLYVYGSTDESTKYYCSFHHDVISTSDMKTWTITKDVFASKGKNDQVAYNDALLFAPDVTYKNGLYYLYYCQPSKDSKEGVATSTLPTGPFTKGEPIDVGGNNQIDPCVFLDDDGQAYYIWGQFSAKIAKLKPNMKELDLTTYKDGIVTEKNHFFHEGGYMVKRNGIYYFIYAHMGRGSKPTCLGYATSNSPMGPFKYGGVIIDNSFSDPKNWNNHGSIIEFNKQWYVFYHRATHGSVMMRKTCVEPIFFNPDGSINEVEMTTQGAAEPLDAKNQMDAERACLLHGNVRISAISPNNEALTGINKGDKVAYKYIDFKEGVDSVTVNIKPGKFKGNIDFALDAIWGRSIGKVDIPTGDGKTWVQQTITVKRPTGVHAVWLKFNSDGNDSFELDWFKFN